MLRSTEGMTKITITYTSGNVDEHYLDGDVKDFLDFLQLSANWVSYEVEAPQGGGYGQINISHPQNLQP